VNYFQLRVVLPKNADAEPLILLLCKEEEREEWARRFYRLKSLDAIENTFPARLKELERNNAQNDAEMQKLQQERDQGIAAADRAADELARLKPSDATDLYERAMVLFSDDKVPEALAVLSNERIRESIEAARREKARADQKINEGIIAYWVSARLLTTQFEFAEANCVMKVFFRPSHWSVLTRIQECRAFIPAKRCAIPKPRW
jgi:hypothetical protein